MPVHLPAGKDNSMENGTETTAWFKNKIGELEKEIALLRANNHMLLANLNEIIRKLPMALVIMDRNGQVLQMNRLFIEYLDFESKRLCQSGLLPAGIAFERIVPEEINGLFVKSLHQREDIPDTEVVFNGVRVSFSLYTIKKGDLILGIFRDIYSKELLKEEVVNRIHEVIDRNLAMVQKIGFLMGEETCETTKSLHSIIKAIE